MVELTIFQIIDGLRKVDLLLVLCLLCLDLAGDFAELLLISLDLAGDLVDSLILLSISLGVLEDVGNDCTILSPGCVVDGELDCWVILVAVNSESRFYHIVSILLLDLLLRFLRNLWSHLGHSGVSSLILWGSKNCGVDHWLLLVLD